jgi:class 3 adenylate cyclase
MAAPVIDRVQDLLIVLGGSLCIVAALATVGEVEAVASLYELGGPLVGGSSALVALLQAWRSEGRLRRAWTLLGLAVGAWAIGDIVWALSAADPSEEQLQFHDVLYLLHYPLFLFGVLSLPAAPWRPREAVRTVLDLVIAMLGATMVIWHEILRPAAATASPGWSAMLVAAAFPVGDLVLLLALGLLLLRRPTEGIRNSLRWLVAAVLLEVIGDLGYALLSAEDYASGHPLDAAWLAGELCVGLAARAQIRPVAGDEAPATPLPAASAVPYLGILLGFGLVSELAWRGRTGASTGLVLVLGGAAALCALVILRQILAQKDLDALAEEVSSQNERLRVEQERSDRLLLNILPGPIAERLKAGHAGILADQHAEATVLFADLVGFTSLAAATPANELVRILNDVFSRFDRAADRHGVEKIKTIGDAYMAVCGVPEPVADHASQAARMALDMLEAVEGVNAERGLSLQLRIGLHSGPLVAGVIGERKFIYDLWGDTVNVASRMESHGAPGRVHVSDRTRELLGAGFQTTSRGTIDVKGRGPMPTWFVQRG